MEKSWLHIISGDCAGDILGKAGLEGDVLVWHDLCYEGQRASGWPDEGDLEERAAFLSDFTGGGLSVDYVLSVLRKQYAELAAGGEYQTIVLWFDACLFDQSMLAHILCCLDHLQIEDVELICVGDYPGIDPFHGLGQLTPEQMSGLFDTRTTVVSEQGAFACRVDSAFARQDRADLEKIAGLVKAPLAFMPAAARRWLEEQPDQQTGLGLLEKRVMAALSKKPLSPLEIYELVAKDETPPQYWGILHYGELSIVLPTEALRCLKSVGRRRDFPSGKKTKS